MTNYYLFRKEENLLNINFKLLKSIMKENKYTYEYIANALGYSKPFIWQIINNKRGLSYKNALLIAHAFNMKPDELFYDSYIDNEEIKQKIFRVDKVCSNGCKATKTSKFQ